MSEYNLSYTGTDLDNAIAAVKNGVIKAYNVKKYGATGNGSTDDGASIQSALDACNNAGGGIVYFPKGTYCVSRAVFFYSNQKLLFEPGAVILRIADTSSTAYTPGCVFCNWFEQSDTTDGTIACENVEIVGALFDMNAGININGAPVNTCHAKNIIIRDCRFINNYNAHCIEINSSEDVCVENCYFSNYRGTSSNVAYNEMVQIDKAVNAALGIKYNGSSYSYLQGYSKSTRIDETSPDCKGSENINIYNCTFDCNAYCTAIGNHHESDYDTTNNYIRIHNNIFRGGCSSRGYISFDEHTKNTDVYSNTFEGGTAGVTSASCVHNNRFDGCSAPVVSADAAYGNMIDGEITSADDTAVRETLAYKVSGSDPVKDISNFWDIKSSRTGSYTVAKTVDGVPYPSYAEYYVYRVGNRITGSVSVNGAAGGSSNNLFSCFDVKSAYRPFIGSSGVVPVTGVLRKTGYVWFPAAGYITASGSIAVAMGTTDTAKDLRIMFDYFVD